MKDYFGVIFLKFKNFYNNKFYLVWVYSKNFKIGEEIIYYGYELVDIIYREIRVFIIEIIEK